MKILVLVLLPLSCLCLSPSSHLTGSDRARLSSLFSSSLSSPDLASLHYSVLGSLLLGETLEDKETLCATLAEQAVSQQLESLYLASRAAEKLGCPLALSQDATTLISGGLESGSTTTSIFYAANTLASTGSKLDSAKVSKSLVAALKKDDSLLSLGLAFHTASLLEGDLAKFTERIEDAVVQADEVDGKMLQFEGGLSVTSVLLTGAAKLAVKAGQLLPVTGEQALKFSNYLMSRKGVQQVKGAFHLLEAVLTLASNPQHVPIVISLASTNTVTEADPFVVLEVTDLAGGEVPHMTLSLETATRLEDESVVAASQAFVHLATTSKYSLDLLAAAAESKQGFYELVVSATPSKPDKRFIGNKDVIIKVKVLTSIDVVSPILKVIDADQSTEGKIQNLDFPNTLPSAVSLDAKEILQVSFGVVDKGNNPVIVHQAFVKLAHIASGSEIIYLAEPDKIDDVYKFELDLNTAGADLNSKSGEYSLSVILGDAVISNPISWEAAKLNINFPGDASEKESSPYVAKPEIRHVFREPEARPPSVVSSAFTVLCLCPFLLMILLWAKIGVNIGNFQFSIAGIGFHLGLACIFLLYFMFWVELNMFQTVKYLACLGVVTFLCGNSLLATIAKRNKSA